MNEGLREAVLAGKTITARPVEGTVVTIKSDDPDLVEQIVGSLQPVPDTDEYKVDEVFWACDNALMMLWGGGKYDDEIAQWLARMTDKYVNTDAQ